MAERLIGVIPKSGREEFRIFLDGQGGRAKLSVRVFFLGRDGVKRPGRQGVDGIRAEVLDAILTAFARELAQASLSLEAAQ